jgi:hypothetical protein
MRTVKRLILVAVVAATALLVWQVGASAATAIEYGLIF